MDQRDRIARWSARADAQGDAMRVMLTTAHVAAIGFVAAGLSNGDRPCLIGAGLVFVAGLAVVAWSIDRQKSKSLARLDAALRGEPEPDFTARRNQSLDRISASLWAGGAVLTLLTLAWPSA